MLNKFKVFAGMASLYVLPLFVFAQSVDSLMTDVTRWITRLIPIVIALALLYFLWGVAKFVLAAGKEDARTEAKQMMLWGIIALFVMVSVWGLVEFLGNTFGVDQGGTPQDIPGLF